MTAGLTKRERALGRDVIRVLAFIRDGGTGRAPTKNAEALSVAVSTKLATVDYEAVRDGGRGVVVSLTPSGLEVLCLAENGHLALRQ